MVGYRRRGWSVAWLLVGAAAFVAGPFSEVAVGAAEVFTADADSDVDRPFGSAGVVPGLPSERFDSPVADPEVVPASDDGASVGEVGGPRFDPGAVAGDELVGERSAFSQSFRRSDGLLELRVSPEPVAFDAGDGEFELIDTAVETLKEGLGSVRNSFKVFFAGSDEGVSLVLPSGDRVRSRPVFLDGVKPGRIVVPVVDELDRSVVWYRQVWPGVDIRYTVRASGLSEDVVYTEAPVGAGAVTFAVSGVELDAAWSLPPSEEMIEGQTVLPKRPLVGSSVLSEAASVGAEVSVSEMLAVRRDATVERPSAAKSSLLARGSVGKDLKFGPLVVTTGDRADFVDDEVAVPLARTRVTGPRESLVELSVDPGWISKLGADAFPVVVDPDFIVGPNGWISYLGGTSTTCGSAAPACGHRAGHPMIPGLGWSIWRSLNLFDLSGVAAAYGLTGSGSNNLVAVGAALNRSSGFTGWD